MSRGPTEFDPSDGRFHLVYAGALLPKAHGAGSASCNRRRPEGAAAARWLAGCACTSSGPAEPLGIRMATTSSLSTAHGGCGAVTEHPHRMAYLDVLANLMGASGVLIVGSTEPHYTPSKVYQAVQSRRPVLALLHEASNAVQVLEKWVRHGDQGHRADASRAGTDQDALERSSVGPTTRRPSIGAHSRPTRRARAPGVWLWRSTKPWCGFGCGRVALKCAKRAPRHPDIAPGAILRTAVSRAGEAGRPACLLRPPREPAEQARAGFGTQFEWDVDLTSGYAHSFLDNVARRQGTDRFLGCDTPEIGRRCAKATSRRCS